MCADPSKCAVGRRAGLHRHEPIPAADALAVWGRQTIVAQAADGAWTLDTHRLDFVTALEWQDWIRAAVRKWPRVRVYNRAGRCCWDSADGGPVA